MTRQHCPLAFSLGKIEKPRPTFEIVCALGFTEIQYSPDMLQYVPAGHKVHEEVPERKTGKRSDSSANHLNFFMLSHLVSASLPSKRFLLFLLFL